MAPSDYSPDLAEALVRGRWTCSCASSDLDLGYEVVDTSR